MIAGKVPLLEDIQHAAVIGCCFRDNPFDSPAATDFETVIGQNGAETLPVPFVADEFVVDVFVPVMLVVVLHLSAVFFVDLVERAALGSRCPSGPSSR